MAEVQMLKLSPSRRVTGKGPSVGRYRDQDIPAWIECGDGTRHEFSHIQSSSQLKRLNFCESVIHPGLVYKSIHTI